VAIYLRELTRSDIPAINKWRQDKSLVSFLGSPFRYISLETDENWFESYMRNRKTQVRCAVVHKKSNKVIGVVYLTNIDAVSRTAFFGIMIGEKKYKNKGIGKKTTELMLDHAFNDLNLNRVELVTLENNNRAISVFKKCGFVEEGLLRESIYKNGKYHNQVCMSILKREYLKRA